MNQQNPVGQASLTQLTAAEAHAVPFEKLPALIRLVGDERARLEKDWSDAYGNFKEQRRSLAVHYLQHERLPFSAADWKAECDPQVIEASEYSLAMKQQLRAHETLERQLIQEFEMRLALLRRPPPECREPAERPFINPS